MGSAASSSADLTKCSICEDTISAPRSLPCLHTFCVSCLQEWSAKHAGKSIECPSPECRKTIEIPDDGVEGFPVNLFVLSLINRSAPSSMKKQKCVCCLKTNDLISRCFDCNGLLCQIGADAHQLAMMKDHHVVSIRDLQLGTVDVRKFLKPPMCLKHKEETLWLFCQTCGVLICQKCTVLDHCKPDHKFVELGVEVIKKQKEQIDNLQTECKTTLTQIEAEIDCVKAFQKNLLVSVYKCEKEMDKTAEQFKKYIDQICKEQKETLKNWEKEASDEISKSRNNLESRKFRVQTAQEMAKQIVTSGSDHDIAGMFSHLTTAIGEACGETSAMEKTQEDYCVEFQADNNFGGTKPLLGILKFGNTKKPFGSKKNIRPKPRPKPRKMTTTKKY